MPSGLMSAGEEEEEEEEEEENHESRKQRELLHVRPGRSPPS